MFSKRISWVTIGNVCKRDAHGSMIRKMYKYFLEFDAAFVSGPGGARGFEVDGHAAIRPVAGVLGEPYSQPTPLS
jgi:hypothetical protein